MHLYIRVFLTACVISHSQCFSSGPSQCQTVLFLWDACFTCGGQPSFTECDTAFLSGRLVSCMWWFQMMGVNCGNVSLSEKMCCQKRCVNKLNYTATEAFSCVLQFLYALILKGSTCVSFFLKLRSKEKSFLPPSFFIFKGWGWERYIFFWLRCSLCSTLCFEKVEALEISCYY